MDVDSEVAVVLNKGILDDNGSFPEILHQDAIVHILRDLTIGYLYRHGKLLQENKRVLKQSLRPFRATTENSAALVTFYDAVLNNERGIIEMGPKPALRVINLAVFEPKSIPLVHFGVHMLDLQIVVFVFAKLVSIQ